MNAFVRLYSSGLGIFVGEYHPISLTYARRQSEPGSWSFSIAGGQDLYDTWARSNIVGRIYIDGTRVMQGDVQELTRSYSEDNIIYDATGAAEVSELSCLAAAETGLMNDGHYQNQTLQTILIDLFGLTGTDWQLGNITTLEDPLRTTTVDLRGKTTLMEQVIAAVNAFPNTFYRYGGQTVIDPITPIIFENLDLGLFGTESNWQFTQADSGDIASSVQPYLRRGIIRSIQINEYPGAVVNQIIGNGGTYEDAGGNEQVISLNDAIAMGFTPDPAYPVVSPYAPGDWGVRNRDVFDDSIGCGKRQNFEIFVTDTETGPPTPVEVYEASVALYQAMVAELQRNSHRQTAFTAVVDGLITPPPIGDMVHVNANYITSYNNFTGQSTQVRNLQLNTWLRVIGWEVVIEGDRVTTTLELSTNTYVPSPIREIQMYDILK